MKLQNIDDVYKLSPVQQDLLSERWSAQAVYAIEGPLDYARFKSAWEQALLRHATLRTAFHSKNLEKPVQVVQQQVPVTLIEDDWQHLSASEQLANFEAFKTEDHDRGFELQRAPLMRLSLIRFAGDVHRLVWTYHPLILDRPSVEMVFDDVLRFYANEEIAQPAACFREYISWLRQQDAENASAFWTCELSDSEAPSTLNGVIARTSATRNEQQLQLPTAVHAFLKQHTLSMESLLAAGWALVLCRYNDEHEAVFGFEFPGRPISLAHAGSIAGPFIHVLPARIHLSRGERLLPWLKGIDAWLREADQHQHVSVREICNWTDSFESVISVAPDTAPISFSELRIELLDHVSAVDHRLVLTAREAATPSLSISYDPSCFKDLIISGILRQLKLFMEAVAHDPHQRVADISLLTAEELHHFEREENPGPLVSLSVHELFEKQAAATPESTALVFGEQSLSYAELNERANQLAHHLHSLGVDAETNVGVCVHRSIEAVVSLLAILKAGGVYIPLDPQLPSERLSFILEETNVPVLVTQQDLLFDLPPIVAAAEVVCLDLEWDTIAQQSAASPGWTNAPEQIAYIIYTSGSTGRPKGVCIPHAAAANHLVAIKSTFGLTAQDRMLQFASLSFDVSIEQILAPLLAGATVVLRPGDVWNPTEFWEQVVEQELTVLNLPPAYWNQIAQELDQALIDRAAQTLRLMIVGGDTMPPDAVQRWQQSALGRVRLLNAYGPTETTITASVYDLPEQFTREQRVPIGTRVGQRRLYVLDRQQRPVVTGGRGELYIGGVELAREYFRDAALTAERFLPDPFSAEPGSRMYRTGDVVRRIASGELSYEGRRDNQVKVRGYRIELGDIEAALAAETEVHECVVALKERDDEKRLVAYVVLRPDSQLQSWELRAGLKERLPEHMLPASIVVLDSLPLTASGKVDRRALPDTDEGRPEQEATFAEPRNETETRLAAMWIELLGITRIGIADNFFEAGGDSLLATQLIARVNKQFQTSLPLRALFDQPTIADLARNIEVYCKAEQEPQIESAQRSNKAPLSYAQERLWFMNQLQPHSPLFNIATAVQLRGDLNLAALEQTFQEITRRHESLRSVFEVVDDAPVQVVCESQPFSIPVLDVSAASADRETEVQRYINEEAQRPFDLTQLPLLRVTLLRLSEDEHVLILVMHHIVSDGWSIGVLVREVAQLYEAFSNGGPSPLRELPLQYADFATWEKRWLEEEEGLNAQFDYWRQQLSGRLPNSPLTPDRPRPEVSTHAGATRTFEISTTLTQQLYTLGSQQGVTLFMILMAAFQTLLHKHSGQEDIIVGTDLANRNRMEVEDLIGFFVNVLPIRTRPAADLTFSDYLQQVRQVTLDAYENQDLPFDRLVTELQPDRRLNRTPIFQNLFVMQNTPMPPAKLSGLELTRMEIDETVAKFDLAVFMEEKEERLIGRWNYSTELFDATTIVRLATRFTRLLESIVNEPATKLGALEMQDEAEAAQEAVKLREHQDLKRNLLRNASRQRIKRAESVVKTSYLSGCEALPLVIEPAMEDVELAEWASHNFSFIETELLKHGALLFRNFRIASVSEFERCASTICPELFSEYGDLPREQMGRSVYGSTPYPSNQTILFHNESSHLDRWPMKIWFFCVKAARAGGETPIVDCRRVYSLLPPAIKKRLAEKGIKYVRNYTEGLDVSWSDFFHTTQREQLEQQCRERGIEWQWHHNDLRTSKVRSAITQHPKTGETVFFNQLQLHHSSCLEPLVRESLLSTFGEERLPRNVYYGDGSRLEDEVMAEIGAVYEQAKVSFCWQEGDIMMLDNMLVAHGRNPFEGERKIVVALGEMCHEKAQKAQVSATN